MGLSVVYIRFEFNREHANFLATKCSMNVYMNFVVCSTATRSRFLGNRKLHAREEDSPSLQSLC